MFDPKSKVEERTPKSADFILQPGIIPILVLEPYGPTFAQAIEKLASDPSVQIVECTSAMDAVSVVRKVDSCLILCHAATADDLVKHITLLKMIQSQVQSRKARLLVTTAIRQGELLNKLNYHGCSEILAEPISAKALVFKIERHFKALPRSSARSQASSIKAVDPDAPAGQSSGSASAAEAPAAPVRAEPLNPTIKLVPPLELESDCWLLSGGGAKRIGGRWVVKLTGPGPSVGRWTQIEGGDGKEHYWQWKPANPEQDPFIKEEGAWVFDGQRPEFQEDLWLFVGKEPWLGFFYNGECFGYKIQADSKMVLKVAKDSATALANLPQIQKSALKVIRQIDEKGSARARGEVEIRAEEPSAGPPAVRPEIRAEDPQEGSPEVRAGGRAQIRAAESGDDLAVVPAKGRTRVRAAESAETRAEGEARIGAEEVPGAEAATETRAGARGKGRRPRSGEDAAEIRAEERGKGRRSRARDTSARAAEAPPQVRNVAPLELESDCWLLQGRVPKKVGGNWMIKVLGPGPSAGRWKGIEGGESDHGERYWQWIPTDEKNDPFIKEEGAWVFRGLVPKFADREWVLVGKEPELAFYYDGQSYGAKISIENGVLLVATDSRAALAQSEAIEATQAQVIRKDEAEEEAPHDAVVIRDDGQEEPAETGGRLAAKSLPDTVIPASPSPKREILAEDGETEYRYDEGAFGTPGGIWEYVCASAEGGKWYAFVPLELINGVVADPRRIAPYWVYRGNSKPEHAHALREWVFRERIPKPVAAFDELIKPVQSFLLDRTAGVYRSADSVMQSDAGAAVFAAAPEGKLLAGRFENERAAPRGPEAVAFESAAPGGARDASFAAEERRGGGAVAIEMEIAEGRLRDGLRGPEAVTAENPPGPSLSPMAFAFLVSELMCRPGLDRRWMSQRFCAYLSASCGGLAAELWALHGENWVCAGTHNSMPPRFGAVVERARETESPVLADGGVLVIPVRSGGRLAGAVLIAGAGAELVSPDYAAAIGRIARGLAISVADTGMQGAVTRKSA